MNMSFPNIAPYAARSNVSIMELNIANIRYEFRDGVFSVHALANTFSIALNCISEIDYFARNSHYKNGQRDCVSITEERGDGIKRITIYAGDKKRDWEHMISELNRNLVDMETHCIPETGSAKTSHAG